MNNNKSIFVLYRVHPTTGFRSQKEKHNIFILICCENFQNIKNVNGRNISGRNKLYGRISPIWSFATFDFLLSPASFSVSQYMVSN